MKLKTSSSNATLLRKDMMRFAPAWGLYTLMLVMGLMIMADESEHYWFLRNVDDGIRIMGLMNLFYAPVVAQLLFGDLYNTRMCNALHALPIKRETWFATHLLAGILFSLIPNLVITLIGIPMLGEHWFVGLVWLVQVTLQYVCYFGIAVAAVFCAGSRFGMLVVYGMINFLAGIVYWMVDSLYEPLLYGMWLDLDWFAYLMPVYAMLESYDILMIERDSLLLPNGDAGWGEVTVAIGSDFWLIIPYALAGIAMIVIALRLYKKRKLEVAGDLIAVKQLEPVFLILFTLCCGVGFNLFCDMFGLGNDRMAYGFLGIGIFVGFFAGRMLLMRTIRVFRKRAIVQALCICAVVAVTLVITWLDPLGVTRWVPDTQDVASVRLQSGGYETDYQPYAILRDQADIENVRFLHQFAIDHRPGDVSSEETVVEIASKYGYESEILDPYTYTQITLVYTMKNGSLKYRYYSIYTGTEAGQMLRDYFTQPKVVLGSKIQNKQEFLNQFSAIEVDETFFTGKEMEELVDAIVLDCREGNMVQLWDYHRTESTAFWVRFQYKDDISEELMHSYMSIDIFDSCTHTVNWLKAKGLQTETEKYG